MNAALGYTGIDLVGYVTIIGIILAAYQLRDHTWKFRLSLYDKLLRRSLLISSIIALVALMIKYYILYFMPKYLILPTKFIAEIHKLLISSKAPIVLDLIGFTSLIFGLSVFVYLSNKRFGILEWIDSEDLPYNIYNETIYYSPKKYLNAINLIGDNFDALVKRSGEEGVHMTLSHIIPTNRSLTKFITCNASEFLSNVYCRLLIAEKNRYNEPLNNLVTALIHRSIELKESILFNDDLFLRDAMLLSPEFMKYGIYLDMHKSSYSSYNKNFQLLRLIDIYNKILDNLSDDNSKYLIQLGESIIQIMNTIFNNVSKLSDKKIHEYFADGYISQLNSVDKIIKTLLSSKNKIDSHNDSEEVIIQISNMFLQLKNQASKLGHINSLSKFNAMMINIEKHSQDGKDLVYRINKLDN